MCPSRWFREMAGGRQELAKGVGPIALTLSHLPPPAPPCPRHHCVPSPTAPPPHLTRHHLHCSPSPTGPRHPRTMADTPLFMQGRGRGRGRSLGRSPLAAGPAPTAEAIGRGRGRRSAGLPVVGGGSGFMAVAAVTSPGSIASSHTALEPAATTGAAVRNLQRELSHPSSGRVKGQVPPGKSFGSSSGGGGSSGSESEDDTPINDSDIVAATLREYAGSGSSGALLEQATGLIAGSMRRGAHVCLVCLETVRHADPVWGCDGCYTLFHIGKDNPQPVVSELCGLEMYPTSPFPPSPREPHSTPSPTYPQPSPVFPRRTVHAPTTTIDPREPLPSANDFIRICFAHHSARQAASSDGCETV